MKVINPRSKKLCVSLDTPISNRLIDSEIANMSSEDAADVSSAPDETTYTDPSGAIFSMYITRALKFDRENVESWKGGADGILIFVRFSVALTMAIAV